MFKGYFSRNSVPLLSYAWLLFVLFMLWIVFGVTVWFFGGHPVLIEQAKATSAVLFTILLVWVLVDFGIIPLYIWWKKTHC